MNKNIRHIVQRHDMSVLLHVTLQYVFCHRSWLVSSPGSAGSSASADSKGSISRSVTRSSTATVGYAISHALENREWHASPIAHHPNDRTASNQRVTQGTWGRTASNRRLTLRRIFIRASSRVRQHTFPRESLVQVWATRGMRQLPLRVSRLDSTSRFLCACK